MQQRRKIVINKGWQNGYGHKITDLVAFKAFVDDNCGLTAIEMAKKWGDISPSIFRKWLHRIGYSCKKKHLHTKNNAKRKPLYTWKK